MSIRVVEPGAFTTVQDLGRPGLRSAGVPASGAMDIPAMRLANRLVGNDDGAAVLEVTMIGPRLVFEEAAVVALTGAGFEVDDTAGRAGANAAFPVTAGATLRIGRAAQGVRGYLAVRGGIDVPPVLGSRSTLVSAGIGGVRGAALKAGDYLRVGPARADHRLFHVRMLPVRDGGLVRALPGPQHDGFERSATDTFWSQVFRVSTRSDRSGVRLEGDALALAGPTDVDPEGVVCGSVQITGDGLPVVLGPDGPATGGYAKIATVITADLPVIAQARPGDTLRFVQVDLERAREALRDSKRALEEALEEND